MLRQRFQLCRTVSRCGFRVGQEENGPVPRRSHGWQNSGTLLRVAVSVKLPANPLARRDKGGRIWSQAGQPSRSSPATTAPATPPGWATATQAILNVTNPNRRELGRSNPLALRNLSFAYQVIHGTQNIPRCEGLRQYLEGIRGKAPQLCCIKIGPQVRGESAGQQDLQMRNRGFQFRTYGEARTGRHCFCNEKRNIPVNFCALFNGLDWANGFDHRIPVVR